MVTITSALIEIVAYLLDTETILGYWSKIRTEQNQQTPFPEQICPLDPVGQAAILSDEISVQT